MEDTDRKILQDIRTKVIVIEEHLKNQNSKVKSNEIKIDKIETLVLPLSLWDKVKTITIVLLSGACGSMLSYILFN